MSTEDKKDVEGLVRQLLQRLTADSERAGLVDTPRRVSESFNKMLSGYDRRLEDEITTFDNDYSYDDLIYSGKIDFFSLCEHHLLPFFGSAHIAYVPGEKIIGLSKLARAVDIYSYRLQEQERITMQIATELERLLKPKGVIVMLEGQHFCNMARGVEKVNSSMKTIHALGCFKADNKYYDRFFQLINS